MHQKLTSTLSKYNKIVLVGGGTGGHIQPIISLVHQLKALSTMQENIFLWIGGDNSQEQKTAGEEGIRFAPIPTLKLSTTHSFKILLYPFFLILGFWKARIILKEFKIKDNSIIVFSKGGPGSVAIGVAAWSLDIALHIHESDTIPGISNKILGKFASKIYLGFASAQAYFNNSKCEVVGQILDPVFTNPVPQTPSLKNDVTWKTNKPHILVICGSQGSRSIFEEIIKKYRDHNEYEWIIALGRLNTGMKDTFTTMNNCQAVDWISQTDIASLISKTDLAITRGSATTLAELTAFRTIQPHLIMIPLPYSASNHQYYNAIEYQKVGHTLLEQKNLHQLTKNITKYV